MTNIDIGAENDFPLGEGVYVGHDVTGGEQIAVFRTEEGIYAMNDRCTHGNYSLSEGRVEDGTDECHEHASSFCLANSKVWNLPAKQDAPTRDVDVVDGRVLLTPRFDA